MSPGPEAEAPRKSVLFLCVENACRSQMAEGFLREMAPESFEAASAGAEAGSLNPMAMSVMAETGIDISAQRSKPVTEFEGRKFDYVITVCGGDTCPSFTGTAVHRETWDVGDPAAVEGDKERIVEAFRRARDEIRERVSRFIERQT